MVSSFNMETEWGQSLFEGFTSVLSAKDYSVEYVGLANWDNPDTISPDKGMEIVMRKMAATNFDMVVAFDPLAIEKLSPHIKNLKDVKVIFAGDVPESHENEQGVFVSNIYIAVEENISLGMKLLPKTKHIVSFTDAGEDGMIALKALKNVSQQILSDPELVKKYNLENVEITHINGLDYSTKEALEKLSAMDTEHTLVLFCSWSSTKDKISPSLVESVEMISKIVDKKILVFFDDTIEDVIGGFMTNGMRYAAFIGMKVKDILRGAEVNFSGNRRIPVLNLNWEVFAEKHFDVDTIDETAVFYHSKKDFWRYIDYRYVSSALFALVLLIASFSIMLYRSTKAARRNAILFKNAMAAAQESEKAKSYFFATMSHEIRTPLNAVIGYSELMRDPNLSSDERMNNVKNINFAGKALLNLINDVLDLSKLEAGQMSMHKHPVDMKILCEEFVNIFNFAAKTKNIYINFNMLSDVPRLALDTMRLRQILMNVIGNAVKFTDKGGIDISVSFKKISDSAGDLFLSVKDSGIGIDKAHIEKIFNPFEQDSTQRMRGRSSYEGTGLGLSIVKRLIENMNGSIKVESKKGEGSIFKMHFKEVEITTKPLPIVETDDAEILGENSAEKYKFKATALVVDDVLLNVKVLRGMLKKIGVESIETLDSENVEGILKVSTPDIILTDLWMPKISGEELAQSLRSNPETAQIPIVAITADIQLQNENNLFDAVLYKPITVQDVFNVMDKFCHDKKIQA